MDRHRLPGVHVDRLVQAGRVHGGAYRERTEDLDAAVRLRPKGVFFTRSVYLAKAEGREVGGGFEFPGYGSLAARWLQVDTDDPVWAMWNAAMERAAFKAAGEKSAWKDDPAQGQDESVRMKLVLLTGAVVSVEVEQDGMGHGAAHPYGHAEAVHWLRAERRELRAEDVFTEGSRWKEMLARRCWTSLVRHFDGDVPFAKSARSPDLLKVVSSPSNWSFSPQGLTIGFPEYSVSPRSMPAGETTVGWDALKPYLRASFARPG